MTRERKLLLGSEDANVVRVVAVGGYERGFGQVHLAGDRLHLWSGEVPGLWEDRKGIPAVRTVREDVYLKEIHIHILSGALTPRSPSASDNTAFVAMHRATRASDSC